MSCRFIPSQWDWARDPRLSRLLEINIGHVARWHYLVSQAHLNISRGKLVTSSGMPLDAHSLAYGYCHDVPAWEECLEACEKLGLLKREDGCWSIVDWSSWYRAPSQYPEYERQRKESDRKQKDLEDALVELALERREREKLEKRLRTKTDPNQLELEISEERPDRISEEQEAERDPDSSPASIYEDCPDQSITGSLPELSGVVRSLPESSEHRSTCKNTCKSKVKPNKPNKPPEREERSKVGSVRLVALEKCVFLESDDPRTPEFWDGVHALHRKLKRDKEDDNDWRTVFVRHLKDAWEIEDLPDPDFWLLVLRFCINETHARLIDPTIKPKDKPRREWGYSASLMKEFAPLIASRKRRGLPVGKFVRLNTLQAERLMLAHG